MLLCAVANAVLSQEPRQGLHGYVVAGGGRAARGRPPVSTPAVQYVHVRVRVCVCGTKQILDWSVWIHGVVVSPERIVIYLVLRAWETCPVGARTTYR